MELIIKLDEENIRDYIKYIPKQFVEDYMRNDRMVIYGIKDDMCELGIAILETDITEVLVRYVYIEERKSRLLHTFVNTISCHMYEQGFEKMRWKFIDDEEQSFRRKLVNMGFVIHESDIAVFNFSIRELSEAQILKSPSRSVISLGDIDGLSLKKLCAEISENGKDIISMPIRKTDFIENCSVVYMEKNVPKGIMLLQKSEDNSLRIPFIYSSSKNTMAIIEMMRFMFAQAVKIFHEDTVCNAYIVEPVLVKIVERITGIKGKYQQVGVRDFHMAQYYSDKFKNVDKI